MISANPIPSNRHLDIRVQTKHGGAAKHTLCQCFFVRVICRQRDGDDRLDAGDAARIGTHLFAYLYGAPRKIQPLFIRINAHDGSHAGSHGRAHEVCRRERFALAVVIHRRVGINSGTAGAMLKLAVQPALICHVAFYHARYSTQAHCARQEGKEVSLNFLAGKSLNLMI